MSGNLIHVAVAVIRDAEGRVLLARRPLGSHLGGMWEFPGGKLEAGENVLRALARELQEELGIRPRLCRPLIQTPHRYPDKHVLLDVWEVLRWQGRVHGRESQPLRWVAPDALKRYRLPPADAAIVSAVRLPPVYLITPLPGRDLESFLQRLQACLEAGVRLVQLRAPGLTPARLRSLARQVRELCHQHGAQVLVNGTPGQVLDVGADGVHLTSRRLLRLSRRPLGEDHWVAASCHNADELAHAARVGVDFAVLSPVAATASHPGTKPMGWRRFAELASGARLPVFALGGMGPADLNRARLCGAQGLGMVSGLWSAGDAGAAMLDCARCLTLTAVGDTVPA